MNLKEAQNIIWSMLPEKEKEHYLADYNQAKTDLANGLTNTAISNIKVINNAPAAYYLEPNDETQLINIVGRVLDGSVERGSTGIVQFESSDIINLLELYFSKQNLEIGLSLPSSKK